MKFVNPESIIANIGLKPGDKVADFGSGAGFFSLAAAKIVGNAGRVLAFDVQDAKLAATKSITLQKNLHNVEVYKVDLEKPLDEALHGQEDAVFVASILHEVNNRQAVLRNAYALLKTGGVLLAVDWSNRHSSFGPAIKKRIPENDLKDLLQNLGFKFVRSLNADTFHYALLFEK